MKHRAQHHGSAVATATADDSILLTQAPAGSRVRLRSVTGGCALATRLRAMGLHPGVEIQVVRNTGHGPIIVDINGSRLMLGRGVMDKVRVG